MGSKVKSRWSLQQDLQFTVRYLGIQVFRYPGIQVFRYLGIMISRYPGILESRYQGIPRYTKISKYSDYLIFKYKCISRYTDIYAFRYTSLHVEDPSIYVSIYGIHIVSSIHVSMYPRIGYRYPGIQVSRYPGIQVSRYVLQYS